VSSLKMRSGRNGLVFTVDGFVHVLSVFYRSVSIIFLVR
jgi:hypothetical protein